LKTLNTSLELKSASSLLQGEIDEGQKPGFLPNAFSEITALSQETENCRPNLVQTVEGRLKANMTGFQKIHFFVG
jgi:hypothetical protein